MQITGHTRPFAVFGHPIGHTLSPIMHNAAYEHLGLDAVYLAFDVPPERLLRLLPAAGEMGFGGINLTVPLKEVAFKGLPDLNPAARRLGAVNTIEFLADGTMRGHNTDGIGFLRAFQEAFDISVRDQSLFILGCGGAGRAVAITCAMEGARRLILADVDPQRPQRLAQELHTHAPRILIDLCPSDPQAWIRTAAASEIIVHATPLGMKPDDVAPLPAEAFHKGQKVFDLVYNIPETAVMRAARTGAATAVNGLGMLLHQGAESFRIWTGKPAPVAIMRAALEHSLYGK